MRKNLLVLTSMVAGFTAFAQPTPFTTCPNANTAIVRAGNNSASTNPVSIYTVNGTTGTPTLLSGPILDPANAAVNLQINGIGLNTVDGYLYGLYANAPAALSLTPTVPFYRLGSNAIAVQLGTIAGPAPTAPANSSIASAAAGEMDLFDNYYFSAATGVAAINFLNPLASTFTVSKMYIGKLAGVSALSTGASALSPTYVEVTNPSNDALAYLTSIKTSIALSTAQNTGLRDFTYNRYDNMLYAYVTYPDPLNLSGNYYGQMLKVDPATGILTAVAAPVILPFATASNEVAGSFLDKTGSFIILFTDGKMYKANSAAIGVFDGSIALLNGSTGLPTTLRGDMASCGAAVDGGILPVDLSNFNVFEQNGGVSIKWQTASEINTDKFVIEKSTDASNWMIISTKIASGNAINGAIYQFTDNNFTQTAFYRLVMVDKNGDRKYSVVKQITAGTEAFAFSTYPNPVTNTLIIESQRSISAKMQVKIVDIAGRLLIISGKKTGNNLLSFDVSGLNRGVYFVRITTETGGSLPNGLVSNKSALVCTL